MLTCGLQEMRNIGATCIAIHVAKLLQTKIVNYRARGTALGMNKQTVEVLDQERKRKCRCGEAW